MTSVNLLVGLGSGRLYAPKSGERQIYENEIEVQKTQEKLEREKEMVDKRRIVLGPRGAIPSAISSPRVRYLEPGSRARESRERREAGASRLSATCAKPPVCVLLSLWQPLVSCRVGSFPSLAGCWHVSSTGVRGDSLRIASCGLLFKRRRYH